MPKGVQVDVLLVEDDPFLYKVLSQRLQKENVKVTVSTDGEAALRDVAAVKPRMILLDLILPKRSGFEVLHEIRNTQSAIKDTPVVVLSNLGQQEDIEQMEKLGIREYLVKADYSLSEMVSKVKEHLSKL
jgi:DNA-binding response OmpR family regulator